MEFLQRTRSSDRATNEAAEVLMMFNVHSGVHLQPGGGEGRAERREYCAVLTKEIGWLVECGAGERAGDCKATLINKQKLQYFYQVKKTT